MAWFLAVLGFSFWGTTLGWTNTNLPGCEFRQTQTAVSAYFIQQEHDFSLAYPTPVLGKPWSIPMEFPLYQWSVVGASNTLDIPLTEAGRLVSLVCFYLALPALYLLLDYSGLDRVRRLLALGLVLCCPLYIFYARAFLIDTMAWMFGVWFLLGYMRVLDRPGVGWMAVAGLGGVGAGLVKVTTLLFLLLPAFIWTLLRLWQARPWQPGEKHGWRAWRRIFAAGLGTVALPCAASIWWVHYSDAIKRLNPAGAFLTSARMSDYNFGIGSRFAGPVWADHWIVLFHEIAPWWVVALGLGLALGCARRWWGWVLMCVALFFAVQVAFPVLYAWHGYYYVANAFLLMLALGFGVCGLFATRLPRSLCWAALLLLCAGELAMFFQRDYPRMKPSQFGGTSLDFALKTVTAPQDVLIIAGDDWNSMTPFYSRRRAYMIRRNLEFDWGLINQAYDQLKGEPVTALVVKGGQRENRELIQLTVHRFGLDPQPVFTRGDETVYLTGAARLKAILMLAKMQLSQITLTPASVRDETAMWGKQVAVPPGSWLGNWFFPNMSPRPFKFYSAYGTGMHGSAVGPVCEADPDSRFWFKAPPGRHTVTAECYIEPSAYSPARKPEERTDGVEFYLTLEQPDGRSVPLASLFLNPAAVPGDRGVHVLRCTYDFGAGATVILGTGPGPHNNGSYDWAAFKTITIQ